MSIIIPANSAVSGGFDVANSLMFDKPSNPYLTRTNGGNGSETKGTYSVWLKRAKLGDASDYIWHTSENSSNDIKILTNSDNNFRVRGINNGSVVVNLISDREFEDVAAWYHLVVAFDSTQGTAANRVKMYINGVQETSFSSSTYPSQNLNLKINQSGDRRTIGTAYDNGGSPVSGPNAGWSGYMAEAVWIDGTALSPTDFGEFDEDSLIWKPISVSGLTFGTNGFYLDFEDSSALGNDAAGSNNFSVSGIAATDQGLDTCTNNFAVNNKLSNIASRWTFTNGNNTIQHDNSGAWTAMISSIAPSVGKYYMETKITGGASRTMFGVMSADTNIMGYETNLTTICLYYNLSGGEFQESGSTTSGNNYGTFADNDTAGIAVDCANNKIAIYKNGSALVTNHTIPATVTGPIGFGFTSDSNSTVYQCNYGSPYYTISSGNADANGHGNFEYTVPTGYFALCTKNLAEYG